MYDRNEILGFETDTVWGIGAHPQNKAAAGKIYELKGRDRTKPLILMSSKIEYILPYVKSIPSYANKLIEKFFPGALTLIFKRTEFCPLFITSGKETVGVRVPNHSGFYKIAENVEGKVLATTSLNFSNQEPVKNYDEAVLKFGNEVNIIKPEECCRQSKTASTVVLCDAQAPVVLRRGDIVI